MNIPNTYMIECKNIPIICTLLIGILCLQSTNSYLLLVQDTTQPGDVIFNASVLRLGSDRIYTIDFKRSAPFVQSLIKVERRSGKVILLEQINCNDIYYPTLFTVQIDSTSNRIRDIDYYSFPLRIIITGKECVERDDNVEEDEIYLKPENTRNPFSRIHYSTNKRINEARLWITETFATFAIPTAGKWEKICLRQSQFINSITDFLPFTVLEWCSVKFHYVSDDRFEIEHMQGDLVASRNVCIVEPMWKISILFTIECNNANLLTSQHRLKIMYHHQQFNDTDIAKRIRRELKNQSPFFEQHLYVANVLEECEPPVIVTTVKARDPENSSITYSMTSLLDSRTQSMFDIDSKTGIISTKVQLDRELVDVHYFRVTALDDSFPPRSGTTMLQINVQDANDHSPVFEMNEYDANIKESAGVGTTVITLKATDQDIGKNAEVEYFIQSVNGGGTSTTEEDNQAFKLDSKTGVITTRSQLDRETTEVYTLIVGASDLATPLSARRSSTATVVINILDDNDNYPQFSERTYTVSLKEDINWSDSPIVASIKATDADEDINAAIRYAIISGNTQSQFAIDSLTGLVSLVKPLDYETLRGYRLVIRAQDGGTPARSNTTQLLVNVIDVNDNAPRFYTSLFQESVQENVPIGYSILKVQAYDADEGANAEVKYTMSARDASGASTESLPLTVDSQSGWIVTTRVLDREDQAKFMFQIVATDQGDPPQSASTSVVITVQDVNDNDPVFEPKIYELTVAEDDPPGTPVTTVTATDADEDNKLHYEITSGNVRGRFAITSHNGRGQVSVAQPLDYKQEKRFVLSITATDSGGRSDTATVYINITDANNYAPVFENAPYSANVFEDVLVGTTVLVVSATDNDVGLNAQITYFITDDSNTFAINAQTGAITTVKALDRETVAGYLLTVTARDGGKPPMSDTTDVEIVVTDVNDNYPQFKQPAYSGSVPEDALIGTSVVQVVATDLDVGFNGRVRYTLSEKDQEDGSFVIDPASGVIRTNKGLDRESVAFYELEAYAIDRGSPTLSSSVPVTIRLEDINDSPPAFSSDKIVLYIPENSPIGSTVGDIYAKDPDEGVNAIVHYSIIGGEDAQSFSLLSRPGSDKASLVTMVDLDYETSKKKYDLVVRAASPPLRSDAHVEVLVTDVNDNSPVLKDFQIFFNNFKDCFPTGPIGKIPAFDADVSDKLHFKILTGNNANLIALNESTGGITLSPQLNTNVPKLASMEVSVADGVNEVKAVMQLIVRLITKEMLHNSITVRLNQMTKEAFLSPLLGFFIDALAAIIPCPKENVILFSIQDDVDVNTNILNVSFSVRRPDTTKEEYYMPQLLQERVYLNREILARLSTVQILPFDDNLCVREPCLNYEECLTVLKFGNASGFIHSDTVLFRPIYPVTTFTCQCPKGFTGSREHYLCDTEVNLCYSSPCKNGGVCKIKEGGYACICSSNYTGNNCEIELEKDTCTCRDEFSSSCNPKQGREFTCEDCASRLNPDLYTATCHLKTRSFSKGSFLTFPSLRQRHRLHISMEFATPSLKGLLLYNGRYNEHHDFIALEVVEGDVQFSFSLGSSVVKVKASIPGGVSDGQWHSVVVSYFNKSATLSIDGCDTALALKYGHELGGKWSCASYAEHVLEPRCASLTETCHRFLDLTGPLQLGGLPSLGSHFQVENQNFQGCISNLKIDYMHVDLNSFITNNGTIIGCQEKRNFCDSQPCQNGGKCTDTWSMFLCECPEGFGGRNCGEQIGLPWHFTGDGTLSFNPLLRPIQLPWLNAMSVRTLQEDSFLMSVQVGQNSSTVLSLSKGVLTYSYNGKILSWNPAVISDGNWHHVEVSWVGTEIRLSLDFGKFESSLPFSEKIQGLYVGKILIGGPDNSFASVSADYNYLVGCVQDVRIGNRDSVLNRPTTKDNVEEGCFSTMECQSQCPDKAQCLVNWGKSHCECTKGHVGPLCVPVCSVSPCEHGASCQENYSDLKGYKCNCNSSKYSGEYCEIEHFQPCPAGWWGYPICGPCSCEVNMGYNPDCDKNTGKCHCKENHYRPAGSRECIACDCYGVGSFSSQCDRETGKCHCRDGVIGQKCDSCPNAYAEITLRGCEVVYDGCPRSSSNSVWWPRTPFGKEAIEACPKGSHGKVSRLCEELSGWLEPNSFNCTSDAFLDLREQLSNIEAGTLSLDSFVTIKLAEDLKKATQSTRDLYGADVLITYRLLKELLNYESHVQGLNLTHSQDKDYISNLMHSLSVMVSTKYKDHWSTINQMTGGGVEDVLSLIEKYIIVLLESQHDTYTSPFEIVTNNVVLGLDIVTPESLYGYEQEFPVLPNGISLTTESVVLPDVSNFFLDSHATSPVGPLITFPKYNNYILDKSKFDLHSEIHIPLALLGITILEHDEVLTKNTLPVDGAIISYVEFKEAGQLLPKRYGDSVVRRWGVDVAVASPVLSVEVLVPEYLDSPIDHTNNKNAINVKLPNITFPEEKWTKKIFVEPEVKLHENDANYLRSRTRRNQKVKKELVYRSLTGISLKFPIKIQLWLNSKNVVLNERSNPQCVHWSTSKGVGEWSRVGCRTELDEYWFEKPEEEPIIVNCSCNHFTTFAVLVDDVDIEFVPEPSLLENVTSYSCFSMALPLLLATYLILAFIRGLQTNSNTIRKNLVLCVLLAELLYLVALKARKMLVSIEFCCKLVAIGLHYLWLAAFSWMLVDAIHLYRMLTEMRDINHGPMRFYYTMGYVGPAVAVALSVGVRAHQYGNYHFCWLSLYESVVWSSVGPTCIVTFVNLCILLVSIRAAFTIQDHVLGFGNLRTLLWVSVIALPLLGITWVLSLLAATEQHPLLMPLLSVAVLVHAFFSLAGYCFANTRVRQNLTRTFMKCMGKKVALSDVQSVTGMPTTSSQNLSAQSRSVLTYHSGLDPNTRRNLGISTSSTTSRSTTKTGSSPYRSDAHLRHTSTSTSNYNSTSDVPSYMKGFERETKRTRRKERIKGDSQIGEARERGDSDSDSDGSDGRSLDLASSHSSDDDESSTMRRHARNHISRQGYLPNITEHVLSRCGTPPSLNVVTNSQLFPEVESNNDAKWASHLPEAYLQNTNEIGRWSAETGSDNELQHKTNSPNPLPHPDVMPGAYLQGRECKDYIVQGHFNNLYDRDVPFKEGYVPKLIAHENLNYQGYDGCSEVDEKNHLNDKYLFPYTAEEDHIQVQMNYSTNNISVPQPTNQISSPLSNPDYHMYNIDHRMGSGRGSALGLIHGSACGSARESPSPLIPPLMMMRSGMPAEPSPWCWEYTVNK